MSSIRIIREYPHPVDKVWRALTEPALMARWAMRPEGFAPVVGTRWKSYGEANRHWRGFVECEVLEADPPRRLRYSWIGDDHGEKTWVSYTLEPTPSGTRLIFEHTGFTGLSGFLLSKLIMGPGWKKMLREKFAEVLATAA
jgi:uncharacterized protein YndB with AHSA1/START domain